MNVAGFIARTKYYSVWCIACVPSYSSPPCALD